MKNLQPSNDLRRAFRSCYRRTYGVGGNDQEACCARPFSSASAADCIQVRASFIK